MWFNRKQAAIALSLAEVEYMAASTGEVKLSP
jgi:hypothetical protein